MVVFHLPDARVADVRFAISPLVETALSLRVLTAPERFPLQVPWERRARQRLGEVDLPVLRALLNRHGHTPDAITPAPRTLHATVAQEWEWLRATDPAVLAQDIRAVTGHVDPALGRGAAMVARVADALEGYWEACLAADWPHIRTVMQADLAHRGHVIARRGTPAALNDLSPTVHLTGDTLEVVSRHGIDHQVDVGDRPLWLLPTLFSTRAAYPGSPDHPPMVMYPARGQGGMWGAPPPVDADAVRALLGGPRARLLRMLAEPASTTVLAARLGVTASAVNQHLQVMRAAGLLRAERAGRQVLYARTELGERLAD